MPLQPASLRRCASCERWAGPRSVAGEPGCVAIAAETDAGDCVGGPWDGQPRRARSACGRWLRWRKIVDETSGTPPATR
jgi:hypothetical protein